MLSGTAYTGGEAPTGCRCVWHLPTAGADWCQQLRKSCQQHLGFTERCVPALYHDHPIHKPTIGAVLFYMLFVTIELHLAI